MGARNTALEAIQYPEYNERRERMRALHMRHRRRGGLRRHLREGLSLGLYLMRLTVHALGFGALLVGMLAVLYCVG